MADKPTFQDTIQTLFQGVDSVLSSKTVVGEAVHIGDTIILPLIDVSFAIGAGSFASDQGGKKQKGAGAIGGKMTPSAILVIQNGKTRLVNVKNQDMMTKILDMIPDALDKLKGNKKDSMTDEEFEELLNQ